MTQALAWGLATALFVVALASFASLEVPSVAQRPTLVHDLALLAALVVAASFLWRSRRFAFGKRVALWIEERVPELRYSIITALEDAESPFAEEMELVVAGHDVAGATRKAVTRPILIAGSALIVAVLLLYISPPGAFGRGGVFSSLSRLPSASAATVGSRLEGLEARGTPPAYTRDRPITLHDPSSLAP